MPQHVLAGQVKVHPCRDMPVFHWVIVGLPGGAVERFGGPEEWDRHPCKWLGKRFFLPGHGPRSCQSLYRADLCSRHGFQDDAKSC